MLGGALVILMLAACSKADSKTDCIEEIVQKRHSGYSYDSSKSVSKEQLALIVKAGQLAPSSYNEQPWRFIICDKKTDPAAYEKVFSTLVPFNQKWVENVPVLIVSVAASKSAHNQEFNRFAQYDTGAAAFSMMLQATSLGLMAHQMGGFDQTKLQALFAIPEDFIPMAVMAIGYETPGAEVSEKKRNPIEQSFFSGSWGKSFENK